MCYVHALVLEFILLLLFLIVDNWQKLLKYAKVIYYTYSNRYKYLLC
jgi:hypothetical protein